MRSLLACLSLLCAACTSSAPARAPELRAATQEDFDIPSRSALEWRDGQTLLQGFIGWTTFSEVSVEGDGAEIDGDRGDVDEFPLIGGGGQLKLGGERVDFGVEGLLSFGGRANAEAFVIGGGGAAVAIDVDMLVFELYGGPFASVFLGDKLRLYGAAGPLMQFIEYEQEGNGFEDDGSGFGAGFYARTGLELALPSRMLIGIGTRWSDTSVDLGGNLGDLDVEGLEWLITVSRGI
jgi:opacity protein-like surface antigen